MPFMLPDIERGVWIEIDGNAGTEFIPPGYVTLPDYAIYEEREAAGHLPDDMDCNEAWLRDVYPLVKDYIESSSIYSAVEREGYGVRLSAPGYMDCTEWSVFDTEAECRDHLAEFWEVCPDCGEPTDCEDCECCAAE